MRFTFTVPAPEPLWTPDLLQEPHAAADKAGRVRRMFNAIAPRYELVNAVFSGGRDAAWRRKAVHLAAVRHDDDVLDVACGTGNFARAFAEAQPQSVTGCDFAHEMLRRAGSGGADVRWCEADALRLPFAAATFSLVSCAFGVRNFQDLDRGLAEMFRVLRPGGRAVILEFTRPENPLIRGVYELYTRHIMPVGARLLSGDHSGAYRYLPKSVVTFLDSAQFSRRLLSAGFAACATTQLTLGAVTVYVARREDR